MTLVQIGSTQPGGDSDPGPVKLRAGAAVEPQDVLLVKAPYFSPWTPPLGIAVLKSFVEEHGHRATCFDYNVDPALWGAHHRYFEILQSKEELSLNDGYSKLWWILNAHLLSFANGASADRRRSVIATVVDFYNVYCDGPMLEALDRVVSDYFARFDEVTDSLDLGRYDAVGASTYTTSLASSLRFLQRVKQRHPHVRTIMGGGVFADDLALESENLDTLVEEYDFIDHVVLGEGELLLLGVLEGSFDDRKVVSLQDVDRSTLPMQEVPRPIFSDFDVDRYYHLSIEGARSCPFQCSFCSETIQWGEYRKKPMELFVDQVTTLAEENANPAFFMGDSLMDPYIMGFSRELLARDADIRYDGYLRADKLAGHRDKTRMWASSGLYRVRLGVESASAAVLEKMVKYTTPQTIAEALKSLSNAGIRTTTYWIVGFPGETEEHFQETLDFIRENHRSIYELEAHPFYYYPYGQIGSRFYDSYSLYPEEVTDVLRFKVWEVENADPGRQERYRRLRRISRLASDLGIPNIYTMEERYAAEERWQRLHPRAVEIFPDTWRRREPLEPGEPFAAPGRAVAAEGAAGWRIEVDEAPEDAELERALSELAGASEVLRLRMEDGRYHPAEPVAPALVAVEGEVGERLAEVAADLAPRPGESAVLLVARHDEAPDELVLLVHRALTDVRGAGLLLEDLYRVHRQLAEGREPILPPAGPPLAEVLPADAAAAGGSGTGAVEAVERASDLAPELAAGLRGPEVAELGFAPADLWTAATAAVLARTDGDAPELAVRCDERRRAPGAEHTVGPLTRYRPLVPEDAARTPEQRIAAARAALEDPGPQEPSAAATDGRHGVRLDLEGLSEPPWLGGDDWRPVAPLAPSPGTLPEGVVELRPAFRGESLELVVRTDGSPEAEGLASRLEAALPGALDELVEACRAHRRARAFWASDLTEDLPSPPLRFAEAAEEAGGDAGWSERPVPLEPETRATLATRDEPLEAWWSALLGGLLARLDGARDLLLLTRYSRDGEPVEAPLRLRVEWDRPLAGIAGQIAERLEGAREHRAHALEVLERALDRAGVEAPPAALVCDPEAAAPFADHPQLAEALALVLEVGRDGEARLRFRRDRVSESVGEELAHHLSSFATAGAARPEAELGAAGAAEGGPSETARLEAEVFEL